MGRGGGRGEMGEEREGMGSGDGINGVHFNCIGHFSITLKC